MHINDFDTLDKSKLSIDELKQIEGTEDIVYAINKMNKFIIQFNKIPYLAKNFNWYIEPSIKQSVLKKLFKVYDDETKVNDILIKYYKENANRIYDDLKKDFPKRKEIFDEVFYAHNNGLYYLSCIVFMTQVDGVVYDFLNGKNYFTGKFFKETTDILNKLNVSTVGTFFLQQLFNDNLPIKLNDKKREIYYKEFNHLNRHQIIHGENTNFNTEINSLKSLSLLATLAFSF